MDATFSSGHFNMSEKNTVIEIVVFVLALIFIVSLKILIIVEI